MNRRQKIIVSVTGIFIVLLVLLGLTYAYFLTRITGNSNPTSISVTTANLELVYGDGTTDLLTSETPIEPGKFSSSKDFTVTNNGNALTDYAVTLEDFSITYANDTVIDGVSVKAGTVTKMEYPNDLKMEITCIIESDDETRNGKSCTNQITDRTLPTENSILLTNSIEVDDVHKYVLTLTYVETGSDQSKDMNKTIKGKIDIIDPRSTIDLTGSVATYQTGDYVEINSTPIKSEIVDGKYKLIGVEPGSHTLYVKYKDSDGNIQTRGSQTLTIKKGEEASVNGSIITFTNVIRKVKVDINNNYELIIGEIIPIDIFSKYNMIVNGDFQQTNITSSYHYVYRINSGTPVVASTVYNTLGSSLKCFGTISTQIRQDVDVRSEDYYIAAKIRVDRYEKGSAGISLNGASTLTEAISLKETTNKEFVTSSRVFSANSGILNVFIGSYGSANLDCYIDDVVLIPLSVFKNEMTKEELDSLYNDYVSSLDLSSINASLEADREFVSKFMTKVNEKASALGMTNSHFKEPSGFGLVSDNQTTARDVIKLVLAGTKNNILNNIWDDTAREVKIQGYNARTKSYTNVTYNENVAKTYPFLGGKTGSFGEDLFNVASVTEIDGKTVIGVILGSITKEDRFSALEELFDISSSILSDENYDTSNINVTKAPSAISCVITDEGYEILFEQNANELYAPASITKILTALTALDYIKDLDDTVEFKSSDVMRDTVNLLKSSDIVTYEDILYLMMLPSSNQAAQALARTIGEIL